MIYRTAVGKERAKSASPESRCDELSHRLYFLHPGKLLFPGDGLIDAAVNLIGHFLIQTLELFIQLKVHAV